MSAEKNAPQLDERVARLVAEAIQRTKFGTVTITIHDHKVQFVEATQKTRLTPPE